MSILTIIMFVITGLAVVATMTLAGIMVGMRWATKLWAPPENYKEVYEDRPITLSMRIAMFVGNYKRESL